jgi:hypothetical protein
MACEAFTILAHVSPADFWYSTLNKHRRYLSKANITHTFKVKIWEYFPHCGEPSPDRRSTVVCVISRCQMHRHSLLLYGTH